MQEYWINVYEKPINGICWDTKQKALEAQKEAKFDGYKCFYRIHVKMKPLYIQTVGRATRPLKQEPAKHPYHGIHESWKWI